jgi:hypothetical protein
MKIKVKIYSNLKTGLWHHSKTKLYRNHDISVPIQTAIVTLLTNQALSHPWFPANY